MRKIKSYSDNSFPHHGTKTTGNFQLPRFVLIFTFLTTFFFAESDLNAGGITDKIISTGHHAAVDKTGQILVAGWPFSDAMEPGPVTWIYETDGTLSNILDAGSNRIIDMQIIRSNSVLLLDGSLYPSPPIPSLQKIEDSKSIIPWINNYPQKSIYWSRYPISQIILKTFTFTNEEAVLFLEDIQLIM